MVMQLMNFRMSKETIEQIKKIAKSEGINLSEYIRKRVYAEPIILEELKKIKQSIKNAKTN